jgi:hypothetical protein
MSENETPTSETEFNTAMERQFTEAMPTFKGVQLWAYSTMPRLLAFQISQDNDSGTFFALSLVKILMDLRQIYGLNLERLKNHDAALRETVREFMQKIADREGYRVDVMIWAETLSKEDETAAFEIVAGFNEKVKPTELAGVAAGSDPGK